MLSSGIIRIVPDQIIFRDLVQGQTDTCEVWIHNVGKKPIKIRFSVPYNSPFKIISPVNATLVSGLETKVVIQYFCKKTELINSELSIIAADSSVKVPIIAYPPAAQVQLNTQKIEIGNTPVGMEINRKFSISNFGKSSFSIINESVSW